MASSSSFFDKLSKFFESVFSSKKKQENKKTEITTVKNASLLPYQYVPFHLDTETAKNAVLPNYATDSGKMNRAKSFINTAGIRQDHDLIYNIDNTFHMMLSNKMQYGRDGIHHKSIDDVIDYRTYMELCEEYDYFSPNPEFFPDLYNRQPKYPFSLMIEKIAEFRKFDQVCVPFGSRTLSIGSTRQSNFDVYSKLGYINKTYDKLYPTLNPGEMFKVTQTIFPASSDSYFRYSTSKTLFSVTTDRFGEAEATNGIPNLDSLIPLKETLKPGCIIMYVGWEKLNDFLAMKSFTATWLIDGKIVNAIIPITCIEKIK